MLLRQIDGISNSGYQILCKIFRNLIPFFWLIFRCVLLRHLTTLSLCISGDFSRSLSRAFIFVQSTAQNSSTAHDTEVIVGCPYSK